MAAKLQGEGRKMFDTMTGTKIVGGVCGALLVFMLINWAGETLLHVETEFVDGQQVQAFTIPVEDSAAGQEPEEEVDIATVLAEGDAASGEKLFGKCKACHTVEGRNATGPHLDGVVGRPVASVGDYSYSSAMAGHGGDWTPEDLYHFLNNPKGYIPGTKMSFAGFKKPQELADIVAFLESKS